MIASEYKDSDGFKLQFEESVPLDDRKYYMQTFPKVDDVAKDRLHCTTCDLHLGTAPISEKIIRTHQILNVTQCNKCFAFYNSGEFGKGEDGSEYYCRWCGQGGEVFCCSSCPYVFCNKCIRNNLTQSYVKEIERNDDWSCFVCNKDILRRHRAQHWALRNYMNKQLEIIQSSTINSEEELNNMLNEDSSNCCPKKKRKQILKPTLAPIKRPSMNGVGIVQPPAKKMAIIPASKPLKIGPAQNYHQTKPGPKPGSSKSKNDEIVCTPDIMGLFNENNNTENASVSRQQISKAPPPLIMRQNQRPTRPTAPTPNPIYHTVNGFQIDLNHAARQEIFRLPNGKLIQVRKQTNPTQPPRPANPGISAVMHRNQFLIRPQNPVGQMTTQSRMARPGSLQLRVRAPSQPQQRFTFSDGRVVPGNSVGSTAPAPTPSPAPATNCASTIFTQQNGSISVARAPQPDTTFGKAKTTFEDKIINGLEICQHTINKMITLTNSTSFKTSRSFSDLKDLYIHLQYLFTYTSGKFKTLQDNLVIGMEELAKNDESLKEKEKTEDDELEIVEQKTEVVEVFSDDEEEIANQKKLEEEKQVQEKEKSTENSLDIEKDLPTSVVELMQPPKIPVIDQTELLASVSIEIDDEKIKKRTLVKVERLEDSKNPIIKQYMIAIQQRRDVSVSRESSPDFPLEPEVVLEEATNSEGENDAVKIPEDAANTADESAVVEIASDDDAESPSKETESKEKEESKTELSDNEENKTESKENDENKTETKVTDGDAMETNDEEKENPEQEKLTDVVMNDILKIGSEPPVDLMAMDTDEGPDLKDGEVSAEASGEVIAISSTEDGSVTLIASQTDDENTPYENGVVNKGNATEGSNNDADVSMIEADDLSKITENGIEDDKDFLDNLINSLDSGVPPLDFP